MNSSTGSILIVDDEVHALNYLSYKLKQKGYDVHTSARSIDAISLAKALIPDIILLDVMMPEMDGIETCMELRKIKELNDTIIAFLSARSEDYTQIAGFEAGADDYIKKPVPLAVLHSRLKALSTRKKRNFRDGILEVSKRVKINTTNHIVMNEGEQVLLPRQEFELLVLLARNPSTIFAKEELVSKMWKEESRLGAGVINVLISKIRSKLDYRIITTIKGYGYRIGH